MVANTNARLACRGDVAAETQLSINCSSNDFKKKKKDGFLNAANHFPSFENLE